MLGLRSSWLSWIKIVFNTYQNMGSLRYQARVCLKGCAMRCHRAAAAAQWGCVRLSGNSLRTIHVSFTRFTMLVITTCESGICVFVCLFVYVFVCLRSISWRAAGRADAGDRVQCPHSLEEPLRMFTRNATYSACQCKSAKCCKCTYNIQGTM